MADARHCGQGHQALVAASFAPVRAGCPVPCPSHPRRSALALSDGLTAQARSACSERSDVIGETGVEFFNTGKVLSYYICLSNSHRSYFSVVGKPYWSNEKYGFLTGNIN